MKNKIMKLAALLIMMLPIGLSAMPVRYSYTGNLYDIFQLGVPSELTRTTGFFDVPAPLGPNFSDFFVPTGFEFCNGVECVSDGMTFRVASFAAETDASGLITGWFVFPQLLAFNLGDFVGVTTFNNIVPAILDGTSYCAEDNATGFCSAQAGADAPVFFAGVLDNPGTWSKSVIPLPPAAILFLSGLGVLGWIRRRRSLAA